MTGHRSYGGMPALLTVAAVTALLSTLLPAQGGHHAETGTWAATAASALAPLIAYALAAGRRTVSELTAADDGRQAGLGSGGSARWRVGVVAGALATAVQLVLLAWGTPTVPYVVGVLAGLSPLDWYRVAFSTVAVGYLTASGGALLRLTGQAHAVTGRPEPVRRLLAGNDAALLLCAATAFALFVTMDLVPVPASPLTLAPALVVPSSVLVVAAWRLRRAAVPLLAPAAVAGAATTAIALLLPEADRPVTAAAIVAVLLLGIGLASALYQGGPVRRAPDTRLLAPTAVGLGLLGIVLQLPRSAWVALLGLLVADLLALICLDAHWERQRRRRAGQRPGRAGELAAALLAVGLIFLTAALATLLGQANQLSVSVLLLLNGIFSVTLARVTVLRIQAAWRPMVAAEQDTDTTIPGRPASQLMPATTQTWLTSTTIGIGMLISVALLVYQTIGSSFTFGTRYPTAAELGLVAAGLLACVLLGAPTVRGMFHPADHSRDEPSDKPPGRPLPTALAGVGLLALTTAAVLLAARVGWHGWTSTLVLVAAVFVALDCLHTTLFDATLMCLRWPDPVDAAVSVAAAVAQCALLYWALLSGYPDGGMRLGHALGLYGVAAVAKLVAALTAGAVMYARGRTRYATFLPVWWTYLQNDAVRTVLAFTLVWFPVFAMTHNAEAGMARWTNTLIATVPAVAMSIPVFVFGSQRVIEHSYEQRLIRFGGRYRIDPPSGDLRLILADSVTLVARFARWVFTNRRRGRIDEEGFVLALSANLAGQILLRAALVTTTIVGAVAMLSDGLLAGTTDPATAVDTPPGTTVGPG